MPRKSPFAPELCATALRSKQLTVNATIKDCYIAEARVLQPGAQILVRYESAIGLIVKPSQVSKGQILQRTDAIVLAISIEVSVEAADYRNIQASCRTNRRPSQRPFGCDIHHGRRVICPALPQEPLRGYPELQAVITRQRQAAYSYGLRIATLSQMVGGRLIRLFRMYDR